MTGACLITLRDFLFSRQHIIEEKKDKKKGGREVISGETVGVCARMQSFRHMSKKKKQRTNPQPPRANAALAARANFEERRLADTTRHHGA